MRPPKLLEERALRERTVCEVSSCLVGSLLDPPVERFIVKYLMEKCYIRADDLDSSGMACYSGKPPGIFPGGFVFRLHLATCLYEADEENTHIEKPERTARRISPPTLNVTGDVASAKKFVTARTPRSPTPAGSLRMDRTSQRLSPLPSLPTS